MTQREVALERLFEKVGVCLRVEQFHIPLPIAEAYLDVRRLTPHDGLCEVCHDGDSVANTKLT